ncbi:MAG: hypothetical protein ACKVH8_21860 [Pirellulales bacterium]
MTYVVASVQPECSPEAASPPSRQESVATANDELRSAVEMTKHRSSQLAEVATHLIRHSRPGMTVFLLKRPILGIASEKGILFMSRGYGSIGVASVASDGAMERYA